MVGELRDLPTANIIIQAALTGHLVFTTLHVNSAPVTGVPSSDWIMAGLRFRHRAGAAPPS
jgi:hypothetical protein